MNILDASTLINLINGNALELVLKLEGPAFMVTPIVVEECGSHRELLLGLIAAGRIRLADNNSISASHFLTLLEQYGLGVGETECLAFAVSVDDAVVCCDDGAARAGIANAIGRQRLSGSLGLLREAVRQHQVTAKDAFAIYEQMRVRGGFLPAITESFFW